MNVSPCRLAHVGSVQVDLRGATLFIDLSEIEVVDGFAAAIDVASEHEPVVLRLLLCPSPDRGLSVLHQAVALPQAPSAATVMTADGDRRFVFEPAASVRPASPEPPSRPSGGLLRGMGGLVRRTVDAVGTILPSRGGAFAPRRQKT